MNLFRFLGAASVAAAASVTSALRAAAYSRIPRTFPPRHPGYGKAGFASCLAASCTLVCLLGSAVPAQAAATVVNSFADVEFWAGTGSNEAVLVLDWQDSKHFQGDTSTGERSIAWGFRWSGAATGIEMLKAIDQADPRLRLEFSFFEGFGEFLQVAYYDLDGDGGFSDTPALIDADDHYRDGLDGYWHYYISDAGGGSYPSWSLGNEAQVGATTRMLVNGSWDAWVYTDYEIPYLDSPNPSIAIAAPVPEPGASLILLGAFSLFGAIVRYR